MNFTAHNKPLASFRSLYSIMEPIPEVPGSVHFYKLLFHLSIHNNVPSTQITLRPPPTLLSGFGFSSPTLMHFNRHRLEFREKIRPEEAIAALEQTDGRPGLPLFVLKAKSGKQFASNRHTALSQFAHSVALGGKGYLEDAQLQPFLICSGGSARVIEAQWNWRRGVSVKLHKHPRQLIAGVEVTYTTSDLAEVVNVATSISTEQIRHTLELVRLVIEKAALQDTGSLHHLSIRMLQSESGLWYFLSLEALQVYTRPQSPQSEFPPAFRTIDSSRPLTSPKSDYIRRTPSSRVTPQPCLFPLKPSTGQRLQLTKARSMESSTSDLRRSTQCGVFRYPAAYLKEQVLEAEVAKLLEQDIARPEAIITYKSWTRRTAAGQPLTLVDQMYAKSLCRQKRMVLRQSSDTLKALQKFKEKVRAGTDEMLFQAEMAERISGKPNTETAQTVDLRQYSKFSKLRQEKLDKDQLQRREKEGVAKVVQDSFDRYNAVTLKIRTAKASAKLAAEQEDDG